MSHSLVISPREIELKEVSLKDGTAVGLITTDTVDRYREIVDPGGAQLEHFRRNPVVLLNHNSWGVPIGKNLWTKNEGRGILAKTQFAPTPEGRDVLALYEGDIPSAREWFTQTRQPAVKDWGIPEGRHQNAELYLRLINEADKAAPRK